MLRRLHIRNFALIEELELEFDRGMNVLTGETGAGKSILLDALGLTLGDRADTAMVRHGSERAEISVEFDLSGNALPLSWLKEQELDAGEECILRRIVGADGRSRGYINGHPSTLQQLGDLGEQLVDLHGQHAHQSLLRRDVQRRTVDAFAGLLSLAEETAGHARRWRDFSDELQRLQRSDAEREARLDLIRYQLEELEALQPDRVELEAVEEEQRRLSHATQLSETVQGAVSSLVEQDEGAILDQLESLLSRLQEIVDFDPQLTAPCEMLEAAAIQGKEAAAELRHYLAQVDHDPGRLAEVEERLGLYHDLARKHRVDAAELGDKRLSLQQELSELENAGVRLEHLEHQIGESRKRYDDCADRLSAGRQQAATQLGEAVSGNMQELGMGGGRFDVNLETADDETPNPAGRERIEFLVSANPGLPLRPLSKVASGGELSRISLALQVIIASQDGIPTLIFDEVDVGIGGGVAEMVGRELRLLGADRQVLCVTHQPQVASQGHHHFRISKQSDGATTRTAVEPLDEEERIEEIARMLGGMAITEQTRAHAREMLTLADTLEQAQRA